MRIPSCGSAANLRLSIGCRKGRLVYLYSGLIRKGSGAVSHDGQPMHIGTFAFPREDVAFHRPVELATDQRLKNSLKGWYTDRGAGHGHP